MTNNRAKKLEVVLGTNFSWSTRDNSNFSIHFVGNLRIDEGISRCVLDDGTISMIEVKHFLKKNVDCYAFILVTKQECCGVVDHIRSYPVYFSISESLITIGNDARLVQSRMGLNTVDVDCVSEFLLSGYVHGSRTLYEDLMQLRAGEIIHVNSLNGTINLSRYFKYLPAVDKTETEEAVLLEKLGVELDRIFDRVVEKAADRLVLVPLSGGLDSRLVLCKLLERNYSNIKTFTYGVAGNHEMLMARQVAEALKVDWLPVESRVRGLSKLFKQEDRINYAEYADGLHATPIYLDYQAIHDLVKYKDERFDAVLINGYSGDFIFGGHIPEELVLFPSAKLLRDKIVSKHCAQIRSKELDVYTKKLRERILDELSSLHVVDMWGLYEFWDWQERQTKAVVNGQRLYEYFDLDWALPFWDKGLMEYWAKVPLQYKLNQNLHIKYLKQFNYKGVFDQLRSVNTIWPKSWSWIMPMGRIIDLVSGSAGKNEFYERMFYFSYFRNQLGMFGYKAYKKSYRKTRRPRVVPMASIEHLKQLDISVEGLI